MSEEKKLGLFDYINSINSKEYIFTEDADYTSFVVGTAFSYFPDTVFIANEINKYQNVDKKQHYDFLYHMIRKGKRYSKWHKKSKSEDVKLISEYYNISEREAELYVKLMTDEQIKKLETMHGGVIKK